MNIAHIKLCNSKTQAHLDSHTSVATRMSEQPRLTTNNARERSPKSQGVIKAATHRSDLEALTDNRNEFTRRTDARRTSCSLPTTCTYQISATENEDKEKYSIEEINIQTNRNGIQNNTYCYLYSSFTKLNNP